MDIKQVLVRFSMLAVLEKVKESLPKLTAIDVFHVPLEHLSTLEPVDVKLLYLNNNVIVTKDTTQDPTHALPAHQVN